MNNVETKTKHTKTIRTKKGKAMFSLTYSVDNTIYQVFEKERIYDSNYPNSPRKDIVVFVKNVYNEKDVNELSLNTRGYRNGFYDPYHKTILASIALAQTLILGILFGITGLAIAAFIATGIAIIEKKTNAKIRKNSNYTIYNKNDYTEFMNDVKNVHITPMFRPNDSLLPISKKRVYIINTYEMKHPKFDIFEYLMHPNNQIDFANIVDLLTSEELSETDTKKLNQTLENYIDDYMDKKQNNQLNPQPQKALS